MNLQLVVVHEVDTQVYVPYYLTFSVLGAFIIVLPGCECSPSCYTESWSELALAIRGAWGWDPLSNSCWVALADPDERDKYIVGTIWAPMFAMAAVASISTFLVLWQIFHLTQRTRDLFSYSTGHPAPSRTSLLSRVALRII